MLNVQVSYTVQWGHSIHVKYVVVYDIVQWDHYRYGKCLVVYFTVQWNNSIHVKQGSSEFYCTVGSL